MSERHYFVLSFCFSVFFGGWVDIKTIVPLGGQIEDSVHLEQKEERERDEGRERVCVCIWCEAFQRQVVNQSLPRLRPDAPSPCQPQGIISRFFLILPSFCCNFLPFFSPHTLNLSYTVVANIIELCNQKVRIAQSIRYH